MNPHLYRITPTHVYFLSGPLSNWTYSTFRGRLCAGGTIYTFAHVEQYMMAAKAKLFHDDVTFAKILATSEPQKAKTLGKQVVRFDDYLWQEHRLNIVMTGNVYKFSQNQVLADFLIETSDRILVEGNARDPVWGAGIAWNDRRIEDESNWRGRNLLGTAHMLNRPLIAKHRATPHSAIDPWTRQVVTKAPN